MKISIKALGTLLLLVTAFASCKKDADTVVSKTTLLTQQPWKLTAYTTVRLSDGVTTDGFAPMSTCYKDDEYVFKSDLSYEGNAGATKCSPGDPQVFQTGTWRFTNNEASLERTISAGSGIGVFVFMVSSLTTTELKTQTEDGTYRHVLTYSH